MVFRTWEDIQLNFTSNYIENIPSSGTVVKVTEGIYWVRMPLPFALDHINLWLLQDKAGWVLVDTGLNNFETRTIWHQIFRGFLKNQKLNRIIVTHFHPDHAGLAGWLCEKFNVELYMPFSEWAYGRMLYGDITKHSRFESIKFYKRAGFKDSFISKVVSRTKNYRKFVSPLPSSVNKIYDGYTFLVGSDSWEVIIGKGHSPEHACLLCKEKNVLISGDQVLPKISPNISVSPYEPNANPLAEYLFSLDVLRKRVPKRTLTLPSHNWPFLKVHQRIKALELHHKERLKHIEEACRVPTTAVALMEVLFKRKLDSHQIFFAIGETIAHLHLLLYSGSIERIFRKDGVLLYCSKNYEKSTN